jgi:hypothetical protein
VFLVYVSISQIIVLLSSWYAFQAGRKGPIKEDFVLKDPNTRLLASVIRREG